LSEFFIHDACGTSQSRCHIRCSPALSRLAVARLSDRSISDPEGSGAALDAFHDFGFCGFLLSRDFRQIEEFLQTSARAA
jgi:hypothetical protein